MQPLTTGVDGSTDGIGAAEQLFLDRARAAGAATGEEDLDDIRAVCQTLDGLPLAIELAAARTSVLTPAELRERLAAGTDVLPVAGPDRPQRQRTLARTIDWSVDLLDDEARAVFDALGVFAGGFNLAAATAVVGGDVLQPLSRLVDASLIVRETAGQSSRFSMLTTVRAASIDRAAEAPAAPPPSPTGMRSTSSQWHAVRAAFCTGPTLSRRLRDSARSRGTCGRLRGRCCDRPQGQRPCEPRDVALHLLVGGWAVRRGAGLDAGTVRARPPHRRHSRLGALLHGFDRVRRRRPHRSRARLARECPRLPHRGQFARGGLCALRTRPGARRPIGCQ